MTKAEAVQVLTGMLEHWERLRREHICLEPEGTDTINALEIAITEVKRGIYEPKIKMLPCTCGRKRISVWFGYDNTGRYKVCQCDNCGKSAEQGRSDKEARLNWNKMIESEVEDDKGRSNKHAERNKNNA